MSRQRGRWIDKSQPPYPPTNTSGWPPPGIPNMGGQSQPRAYYPQYSTERPSQPFLPPPQMPQPQYPQMPPVQHPNVPQAQYSQLPPVQYPQMPPVQYPPVPPVQHPNMPLSEYLQLPPIQYPPVPPVQHPNIPPLPYPHLHPLQYPQMALAVPTSGPLPIPRQHVRPKYNAHEAMWRDLESSMYISEDRYYQNPGNTTSSSGPVNTAAIGAIFDSYRQPEDGPDSVSIAGTMAYFEALELNLESDVTVLAISKALSSPTLGELGKKGFVDGWSELGADNLDRMKSKLNELRNSMAVDEAFFKDVYLWTFNWARPQGQKALPLESALEWWKLLFKDRFSGHLDSWNTFLDEKWKKSVPKDTWNMLYDFVKFAEGDPSLASYDELGSWPSVIDAYVEYYRENNA